MDPTALRLSLAEQIGSSYGALSDVAAVALTGSVARGHADRFSDTELFVVWEGDPSTEERARVVGQWSGDCRLLPGEDEMFVGRDQSGGRNTGLLFEVIHMRRDAVEDVLRGVLEATDSSLDSQLLVHGLTSARAVVGDDVIAAWADRARPYPEGLRRAMVSAYGQVDNFWRHDMWQARSNPLMQRDQLAGIQKQMLVVLQALNSRYHFGFKWIDRLLDELDVAPDDVRRLVTSTDYEDVRRLVEDVYDLVETHVPGVDVERLRLIFRWRRAPWPAH